MLEDPDLIIRVQAQPPADLDSVVQVAQHMETAMKSLTSKSSKLVRAVVQGTGDPRYEAELRDLNKFQKQMLDDVQ